MKNFSSLAADNLLFVFGSFLVNIYAARVLDTQDFADFTYYFAIFNLLNLVGMSFVFEQVMRLVDLSKNIETATIFLYLSVPYLFFTLVAILILHNFIDTPEPIISVWLFIASMFYLYRRYCHLTKNYSFGFVCSLLYLGILIMTHIWLNSSSAYLSTKKIYLSLTIASFSILILYLFALAKDLNFRKNETRIFSTTDFIYNGFSVFGTGLISLFITNLYIILGSLTDDNNLISTIRIVFLIILPINHVCATIITYSLVPMRSYVSRRLFSELNLYMIKIFFVIFVILSLYSLTLTSSFDDVVQLLFSKELQYNLDRFQIFLLIILSVVHLPFSLYLRVNHRQLEVLLTTILSCIFLIGSVYFQKSISIESILISYIIYHLIYLIIICWRTYVCATYIRNV